MCGKDCHCKDCHSKNNLVSCESVLEGTFTDKNCNTFSATMSATGAGIDCESAKKDSEKNIKKTLENFLNCYRPKIVKETHKIKTKCHGCDPDPKPDPKPKTGILEFNLAGRYTEKVIGDAADNIRSTFLVAYGDDDKPVIRSSGNNNDTGGVPDWFTPKDRMIPQNIKLEDAEFQATLGYDGKTYSGKASFDGAQWSSATVAAPYRAAATTIFGFAGTTVLDRDTAIGWMGNDGKRYKLKLNKWDFEIKKPKSSTNKAVDWVDVVVAGKAGVEITAWADR
jgi:hypothetical protein